MQNATYFVIHYYTTYYVTHHHGAQERQIMCAVNGLAVQGPLSAIIGNNIRFHENTFIFRFSLHL